MSSYSASIFDIINTMYNLGHYFSFQNFIIRNVLESDIPTLVPLINEAYSYIEGVRKKPRTNHRNLVEKIKENDYYVVLNQNNVIGCFYITIHGHSLHFGMFALSPNYRGTGLGKGVLRAIERFAKSKSIKTIDIDRMSVSPWLKKYYEDQGFVETGETELWGKIELIRMQKNIDS